ncbi:MAG: hypothetical protein LUC43_03470 [Burkholderiales bacterium]|nr:hypothetical protein [Burkholderiales bacterium]
MALPQESYPHPFSNCSQTYGLKCDRLQLNYDRKAMRSALAKALEKSTDKNALMKAQRKFKASILAFSPGEIVPEQNIYCEDIWTRTRTAELDQLISAEAGTSQATEPTTSTP